MTYYDNNVILESLIVYNLNSLLPKYKYKALLVKSNLQSLIF